jgi:hypothetical protein
LRKHDENTLAVWERKNGLWRICTSQDLTNLYREPDIISEIIKGGLRWLGHVKGMSEETTMKNVFKDTPEGKRFVGKPRKRWLDDIEIHLKKIGARGWRKIAKDRDVWKLILKEARGLHGP